MVPAASSAEVGLRRTGATDMTKRRWLLVLGAVTLVVCVVLGVLATLPARPGVVSKANFDRIEKGMTSQEVAQLLGGPGRPFDTCHKDIVIAIWSAHDGTVIWVQFHPSNGTVTGRRFVESQQTALAKLRRWL